MPWRRRYRQTFPCRPCQGKAPVKAAYSFPVAWKLQGCTERERSSISSGAREAARGSDGSENITLSGLPVFGPLDGFIYVSCLSVCLFLITGNLPRIMTREGDALKTWVCIRQTHIFAMIPALFLWFYCSFQNVICTGSITDKLKCISSQEASSLFPRTFLVLYRAGKSKFIVILLLFCFYGVVLVNNWCNYQFVVFTLWGWLVEDVDIEDSDVCARCIKLHKNLVFVHLALNVIPPDYIRMNEMDTSGANLESWRSRAKCSEIPTH